MTNRRPSRAMTIVLVGALLVVLTATVGVVTWKILDAPTSPTAVEGRTDPAPDETSPNESPRGSRPLSPKKGLLLGSARPTGVRIPALAVDSGKPVSLGINADGTMEVPRTAAAIGWYAQSPTPGARGPAVLAAHVTYNGVDGVFRHIASLKRGDKVEVARTDDKVAVFTVHKVGQYDKDRFPTEEVYGNLDHAGLRLITCAGPFDPVTRRYPDNVVVYAKLTSVRDA